MVPEIVPGVDGVPGDTVTASEFGALVPQLLPAVTDMFPFCPAEPVVTVSDTVPWPAEMDHPVGTVQVYVVAFVIGLILYIWPVSDGHCASLPVIVPGVAGVPG